MLIWEGVQVIVYNEKNQVQNNTYSKILFVFCKGMVMLLCSWKISGRTCKKLLMKVMSGKENKE